MFSGIGMVHVPLAHRGRLGGLPVWLHLPFSEAQSRGLLSERQQAGLETSGTQEKCDTPCAFIYRDALWS